ncbi:hypothetical protein Q5W_16135 [Hydrogenophaga sp. PBC]|nr:hypothetical protein Q5W_16135 [Hydrogenophaga sp. PBC]
MDAAGGRADSVIDSYPLELMPDIPPLRVCSQARAVQEGFMLLAAQGMKGLQARAAASWLPLCGRRAFFCSRCKASIAT